MRDNDSQNLELLYENMEEDPVDVVSMDVPLFVRILEYVLEDVENDADLHVLVEKIIRISKETNILTMDQYSGIVEMEENY